MRDYSYTLSRLPELKKQHQYVCQDCGYKREGLLDQPAIGIGSYSTVCPECGGAYASYEVSKGRTPTENKIVIYTAANGSI